MIALNPDTTEKAFDLMTSLDAKLTGRSWKVRKLTILTFDFWVFYILFNFFLSRCVELR